MESESEETDKGYSIDDEENNETGSDDASVSEEEDYKVILNKTQEMVRLPNSVT